MAIKLPAGLPTGVFLIGKAVGDFEMIGGVSAKGRAYQMVRGKVLAGETFVNLTQSVDQAKGEMPLLFRSGEDVVAQVVPGFKANGLLSLDVKLERPEVSKK
ncbi:MAG: hypothetical protein QM715_15545 [Nibricoccus sp.]